MVKRRRVQRVSSLPGGSIWGDIGNFFTSTIPNAAKKVGNFVKDKKIISRGLKLIPHPYSQGASIAADLAGLGKKTQENERRRPEISFFLNIYIIQYKCHM